MTYGSNIDLDASLVKPLGTSKVDRKESLCRLAAHKAPVWEVRTGNRRQNL